ncbi:MAG: hypothetical protein QXF61_07140 [Nitrososphaeria archaeon]
MNEEKKGRKRKNLNKQISKEVLRQLKVENKFFSEAFKLNHKRLTRKQHSVYVC